MNMAERRPPPSQSFDEALGDFTDGARRSEAQLHRQQRHDNAIIAGLSASFRGSLVDAAEIGSPVVLLTRRGVHHRGAVVAVGSDVVALAPDTDGKRILIALDAIEAIRGTTSASSRGADDSADGPTLGSLLDEFAHDRARAALTTAGGNQVMGVLLAVGTDQVTIQLDGGRERNSAELMTVSLAAIDEAVIEP